MELMEFFKQNPRVALGFSGGVDSSYLLYAAIACGAQVRPYYAKTAFQPQFEFEDAKRLAKDLKVELSVIPLDVLANEAVQKNPSDRCYYCKSVLFGALSKHAAEDGFTVLMDGTNASDEEGDRPGMRALKELSVRSPLRECGITKARVRELSKQAGLFTWDKPAYACLATRVPSGVEITEELLKRVEAAEDALFLLGFSDFRVRVFHGAARLQFHKSQFDKAYAERENILEAVKAYFGTVLWDLEGR